MPTTIRIPAPLRRYTDEQGLVEVSGDSVGAALTSLLQKHPSLKNQLYTDDGRLRAFVNVYLNDEDIRFLQKMETAINPGDTISIVPSIAGGHQHG
jgi:molybdopterin converting factor small subunit